MALAGFPGGNGNYRLDFDWAVSSQNQGGNYTTIYWRAYVTKTSGSGFSGTDGWYAWVDSNQGGNHDLLDTGAGSWSFVGAVGNYYFYDGTFNVSHDGNGYGSYWLVSEYKFGSSVGTARIDSGWQYPARIPKRASAPGQPTFSNVQPTSLTVSWSASGDNGGSGISGYLLRYWKDGSSSYTDHSVQNNTSRPVTGLTPGSIYKFAVYAANGSADNGGWSNQSATNELRMPAGGRIRTGGIYKYAIPYVKNSGVWKLARSYVKASGVWKNTG